MWTMSNKCTHVFFFLSHYPNGNIGQSNCQIMYHQQQLQQQEWQWMNWNNSNNNDKEKKPLKIWGESKETKKKISNYLTTKILNDNDDDEDVIPKHRHPNKQWMNGHIFFLFYVLLYDYLFISRNHIFRIRMLSICFIGGHIGIAKIIIKKNGTQWTS